MNNKVLMTALGILGGAFLGPGVGLVPGLLGGAASGLLGNQLGDAMDPSQSNQQYANTVGYQPPPPPPPANTHGIGETGMTPNQLSMINPRTQVTQALLQQRMRR